MNDVLDQIGKVAGNLTMSFEPEFLLKNPFFWGVLLTFMLVFIRIFYLFSRFFVRRGSAKREKFFVEEWAEVVEVVDGDTIRVRFDDGAESLVRMIGVDTPESVHPLKPVEYFSKEAARKTAELVEGRRVKLVADYSQGNFDKYRRILRYVFLEDGTNVNKLLIKQGFAYECTYGTPYRYQLEFRAAQYYAEHNKCGFWGEG